MTERDPRKDPRSGDVLAVNGVTYKVYRLVHLVGYETDHPFGDGHDNMTIGQWRYEMANAEIIHRA